MIKGQKITSISPFTIKELNNLFLLMVIKILLYLNILLTLKNPLRPTRSHYKPPYKNEKWIFPWLSYINGCISRRPSKNMWISIERIIKNPLIFIAKSVGYIWDLVGFSKSLKIHINYMYILVVWFIDFFLIPTCNLYHILLWNAWSLCVSCYC